jgi:uncharacterized protein (DUF1330 family)
MKHYVIVELDITDQSWVQAYVQNVTPMVERRGGRYLARTSTFERLEGDRTGPQMVVIIEWPSKQAATDFYESQEYRPYRESRLRGARNHLILVSGEDVTRTARIPI